MIELQCGSYRGPAEVDGDYQSTFNEPQYWASGFTVGSFCCGWYRRFPFELFEF